MEIKYRMLSELPALAWIAYVENQIITVLHGKKVETHDDFFVEGAWDGPFEEGRFDVSEWFCGTGAVKQDDNIVFASPTGMHAGLYFLNQGNKFVICNSLPFIMASEGYSFDVKFDGYPQFFNNNVLQGIYKYNENIPLLKILDDGSTKTDDKIKMVLYRNITIYKNGEFSIDVKKDFKGFENFSEYYSRLVSTMKNLTKNAQSENRIYKYGVTSFISSGYDSACCAAIAKESGADKVMTFKATGKYVNDSGVSTAKYLGYKNIIEKEADNYKLEKEFPEIQSISGGDIGFEISFGAFKDDMKNNLVYSGENGDFIWCKNKSFQNINDEYHIVWSNSEIGLGESHLHQEYIPVPMTNYGIRHWKDLYRISNSQEMEAWSIHTEYDRPIPRRILEEHGVPRESFGNTKYGAGFFYAFDWEKRILRRMSDNSAQDFDKFVKKNRNMSSIKSYIRYIWATKYNYLNALLQKLHLGQGISTPDNKVEKIYSVPNPFAAKYLIPWAGEKMIDNYRKALKRK